MWQYLVHYVPVFSLTRCDLVFHFDTSALASTYFTNTIKVIDNRFSEWQACLPAFLHLTVPITLAPPIWATYTKTFGLMEMIAGMINYWAIFNLIFH